MGYLEQTCWMHINSKAHLKSAEAIRIVGPVTENQTREQQATEKPIRSGIWDRPS